MHGSKLVKVHIPTGINLSTDQCPKTQEEKRTCPMFRMLVQLAV
jgi:hypothetical protein